MKEVFLAADFGGGSGRVVAGEYVAGELLLHELHRFPNRPVRLGDTLYWDFPSLFAELKAGMTEAVRRGFTIRSIGVDTWGVDFGLIDSRGNLISNPVCYRDEATAPYPERFFRDNDPTEHYRVNGIQVMAINTLFRLMELRDSRPWALADASRLLFMPDLFAYYLCGTAANERSIASTSELLNAADGSWDFPLIERLGLPRSIFGDIVEPGTVLGTVRPDILAEIGATEPIKVIATASHDTASAIYAVSQQLGSDGAFLSCGTWSLLGSVVKSPVLTEEARLGGFTNESGADGSTTLLQNITGLWILQRLVEEWEREGMAADYPTLVAEAERSGCTAVIDVDAPEFAVPGPMAARIVSWCDAAGIKPPESRGDYMMCVCRSLAERYRRGIKGLNRLLPSPVRRLVIMGGGAKNSLLVRLTAEATGLPVVTGPAEATAMGNIMIQSRR